MGTQTRIGIRIGPIMISRNIGAGFVVFLVAATVLVWSVANWQLVLGSLAVALAAVGLLYVLIRLMVNKGWRDASQAPTAAGTPPPNPAQAPRSPHPGRSAGHPHA